MVKLNNEEMINVQGGAISKGLIFTILGGAIAFLIGVVDGLLNKSTSGA